MPPALRAKVSRAVVLIDREYEAATVDDGGGELARYWGPLVEGHETRWWWKRKPRLLPPGW
jgi:hypothetical protein